MGATLIVGGQYGSEGKGKVAAYLAPEFDLAARTGGPNSGHTIEFDKTIYQLRCIPSAFINPQCQLIIGAGGIIDPHVLLSEIDLCSIHQDRLRLDPQAVIVEEKYRQLEEPIVPTLSSTAQGVGIAVAEKVQRRNVRLARDVPELQPYLGDVAELLGSALAAGKKIMIEGSQGFWLSLHHGFYPFVTSRDTTAGTYCGEIGVGPKDVDDVILVLRTFPIRVGGNSGPLSKEIDWTTLTVESRAPTPLLEYTTVTNRIRRVARFSIDEACRAAQVNSATQIALNFVDYIDYANYGITDFAHLTDSAKQFLDRVEDRTGRPVTLIGTGPSNASVIDLRSAKGRASSK